ncbi:acyl-CoA dehydrogenase family protein [Paucibacter sp. B51]|uniref:acyl-CoA dehydrogenase family protein n=1 Tax=Paucibacter sp. B51 TaxID=2993315 RepID=UPI0022EC01DE|nr:acyl-CoA dehydrogenase family protein [Paucibacter sp. B51]
MFPLESPWLDAELLSYRDSVRRFVREQLEPQQPRWHAQGHVDREAWLAAGQLGCLLADVPEGYGGAGGDFRHMAVFWAALAEVGDTAFGAPLQAVVARYLLHHGTEAQQQRHLPALAAGRSIAAIAITEPAAGSDLQGLKCRAVPHEGGYRINGSKCFVSNGHLADLVLLAVRTDERPGPKSLSLMLVETAGLRGFERGPIEPLLGRPGHDCCELFFNEVWLPAEALLGGEAGKGLAQLRRQLGYERAMLGVMAQASMERALALTLEHSRSRRIYGQPLFDLQHTRFTLAEVQAHVVMGRLLVDHCIAAQLEGRLDEATAALAKWRLSEMQGEVMDRCLQLFGGAGYAREHPMARLYADARVQRIYGGANELMKEVVAYALP